MSTVLIGGNRGNIVGGFNGNSYAQPNTTYVTESFQPNGYATEYIQQSNYVQQPTTTYVQQPTTTYVQQPTTTYVQQPTYIQQSSVPVAYTTGIATSQVGIVGTGEVIKGKHTPYLGESRIEYIPFEQRVTDYEIREWTERIPHQRTITEYQERRYMETVPREVTKVDYYAIEYLKQYIPQVIPETTVETVPVERIVQRTEYIPVERY
jgi:hypothetical protein